MTKTSLKLLIDFLNTYQDRIKEPIADYGGNDKQGGKDVRKTFKSGNIIDYSQLDLDTGYDLTKPIRGKKYNTGICMDLLEHVKNPFLVAENISNSLNNGAVLFVTAPFIWGLHDYPGDYFRYTEEGLEVLFAKLTCIYTAMYRDPGNKIDEDKFGVRVIGVFEKI
jgi:hypothetical protein